MRQMLHQFLLDGKRMVLAIGQFGLRRLATKVNHKGNNLDLLSIRMDASFRKELERKGLIIDLLSSIEKGGHCGVGFGLQQLAHTRVPTPEKPSRRIEIVLGPFSHLGKETNLTDRKNRRDVEAPVWAYDVTNQQAEAKRPVTNNTCNQSVLDHDRK